MKFVTEGNVCPTCNFVQSALRQTVYLAIKELATTAEDVIMVTSSIMKDMQPNSEVIYRPNAIRALCRIIDVSGHEFAPVGKYC